MVVQSSRRASSSRDFPKGLGTQPPRGHISFIGNRETSYQATTRFTVNCPKARVNALVVAVGNAGVSVSLISISVYLHEFDAASKAGFAIVRNTRYEVGLISTGPVEEGVRYMCFSAVASFSASAVLLPVGAYCVARAAAERWTLLPLALVPIAFGVQQFAEGFVWLGLQQDQPRWVECGGLVFLFSRCPSGLSGFPLVSYSLSRAAYFTSASRYCWASAWSWLCSTCRCAATLRTICTPP